MGNDSTPKQLYINKGDGTFEEVGYPSGIALNENGREQAGMGLAVGDLDNDGRLDAVINNIDGPPVILRNVYDSRNHWLTLHLVGDPAKRSPRDAIGAIAYVTVGKMRQRADVISGASYASHNDMRLHFGLGPATKVDRIEIHWPGGGVETFENVETDRIITIVQGKGIKK